MIELIGVVYYLLNTISDCKSQRIDVRLSYISVGVVGMIMLFGGKLYLWPRFLLVAGVALISDRISKASKGALGEGDAYLLALVFLFVPGLNGFGILLLGFFLCSLVGMGILVIQRKRNKRLPLAPFLFISYVFALGVIFYEGP